MSERGWKAHEQDVQEMLGLSSTITSGSKFFDPGDAVTRGHVPYAIYADAKYTENATISIRLLHLRQYVERAADSGRRFIMPIRFWLKGDIFPDDWVLLPASDFAELVHLVNDRRMAEEERDA